MEDLQKLYDVLVRDGYYTKSFEDFQTQFESTSYQDQVYNAIVRDGLFTKTKEEFLQKYTPAQVTDVVKKKDSADLETFLQKTSSEEPSVVTPPTYEVDEQGEIIIPEITEEEEAQLKVEKPTKVDLSVEEKKKVLMDGGLDVDVFIQQAKQSTGKDIEFFSKAPLSEEFKNAAEIIDMSTTDEDAIDILYNNYITNRVFAPQNVVVGEEKLVKKEREDEVIDPDYQTDVDPNIINELNIDKDDYLKWEKETQREETKTFKFIKSLLSSEESDELERQQKDFEKIAFYKTDMIKSLGKDIEQINAKILSGNFNEEDIKKLQDIKTQMGNQLVEEVSALKKLNKMFPLVAKYSSERDLNRRKKIYEAGEKGGVNYYGMEAGESLKRVPEVITDFAMNTLAFLPSLADQLAVAVGADKKGLFAGLTEMSLDASERTKEFLDVGQRQGVAQGKTVFLEGKEYFVTYDNNDKPQEVLDAKTGVRMDGIISDDKIKKISEKSISIPNVEDRYFGGAFVSNTTQTLSNLVALIRTGKRFQKKLGVSGNAGMGLASYTSRAASEVESMRADLVKAGIPEDEAYGKAILAGNMIAGLDGIFSGLAGSNEKLLAPLTAIKQQIISVVKQDGKTFTKKQLADKFKDIVVENVKEVTIEELPVLFSEKAVNRAVNWATDTVVRNADITSAEVKEVVAMTVAATSGAGSKNLLTNNQRQDAVRFLGRTTNDLDGLVNKLVSDGDITLEEGQNLRGEVYEMQVAELQTKGTIVNSENMVQASDLLQQRNKLVEKKKDLEGPLKEDIDKEIENVDTQIREVVEKDKQQTNEILGKTKAEAEVEAEVVAPEAEVEAEVVAPEAEVEAEVKVEEEVKVPETKTEQEITRIAPSVNKILGKKRKKITVDEAVVLRDQIKYFARRSREAKRERKKQRQELLIDEIKRFEGSGVINTRQTKAITNVINRVNLDNPSSVNKALDYVEKVIQNADNIQKLKDANSIRSKIKKAYKRKGVEANLSDAAGSFININPNQVADIDVYLEQAAKVLEGVRPSRVGKVVPLERGVKIRPTFDIKEINQYTSDTMLEQDKKDMDAKKELFEEITGLEATDFTLEEMQEILYNTELTQEAVEKRIEAKEKTIRAGVNKANKSYSTVVNSILETGKDPFTGEKIDLTSSQKKLVKDFLNVDVDTLSSKDALAYVDSLINFATNQTTGGMQVVVDRNKGRVEMDSFNKPENKAKSLSSVAQVWLKGLATLPNVFDRIFKSPRIARDFMKKSGLTDFINGSSRAETKTNNLTDTYIDKFGKSKPNGKSFNNVENITERGLGAFMSRSVEADPEAEFNRRKKLIEESIDTLNKGSEADKKKAKEYQKAYDKILKDSKTIDDVQSKMDNTNLEGIKWWMNEWSNIYNDLSDVSLNTYNSVLGKDINYTPDSFINVSKAEADPEQELGQPNFTDTRTRIYDKKSGVLMPTTKPNALPKGKIINLNFDSQNVSSYRGALTDINTAGSVQQMIGAINSKAFQEIFPDNTSKDVAYDRMKNFVDLKRGLGKATNETVSKWTRRFNRLSGLGTSRVLGGPTQYIKQLVPIMNTFVNAGGTNMAQALGLINNSDVNKLINESGRPIANRGIESQTTTSFNSALDAEAENPSGKMIEGVSKLNNAYLKTFLVSADKLAARSSFIAYYLQNLKKQGIDVSGIDWSTHKLNDKAADYAQQQVDRQQNVSDADLQGELFSSRKLGPVALRKIFFPFANFVINQKTRMYNDIMTLTSKTTSSEDKAKAGRSLGGLTAETLTFNTLGFMVTQLLGNIGREIVGYDEDNEEEQKRINNQIKGRATTVARDIFSPIPFVDEAVTNVLNTFLPDNLELYGKRTGNALDDFGTLGIGGRNIVKAGEMLKAGITGEYVSEYAGKKTKRKLTSKQQDAVLTTSMAYILYSLGLLPSETGYIGDQVYKYATKAIEVPKKEKPMSKTKMKKYTPDLYESLYGKGGGLEDVEKEKAELRKEIREATK